MLFYELRGDSLLDGLPILCMEQRNDQCISLGDRGDESWRSRVFLGREDFPVLPETERRWRLMQGDYFWTRGGRPLIVGSPLPDRFGCVMVLLRRQDIPPRGHAVFRAGMYRGSEVIPKLEPKRSWRSRDNKLLVLAWAECIERGDGWMRHSPELLVVMEPGAAVRIERLGQSVAEPTLLLSLSRGGLRLDHG